MSASTGPLSLRPQPGAGQVQGRRLAGQPAHAGHQAETGRGSVPVHGLSGSRREGRLLLNIASLLTPLPAQSRCFIVIISTVNLIKLYVSRLRSGLIANKNSTLKSILNTMKTRKGFGVVVKPDVSI